MVVFSGGLDSSVCLYLARSMSSTVEAISFDYSQRHKVELKKAAWITKDLKIPHTIVKIPTGIFQNSSLTDLGMKVRKNQVNKKGIPNTYVPARNILFLSYSLAFAESRKLNRIYLGVNALDYSGYPDCRPEFIQSFQDTANLGTKEGIEGKGISIITPLIHLTKREIVLLGQKLNVPFEKTHSCYSPIKNKPCGDCDSCLLRKKGFEEAGVVDGSI